MIDEYWTWRFYGYHSDELKPMSGKPIVAVCDDCYKYRIVHKYAYTDYCLSCASRGKRHTIDRCRVCGALLIVGDTWTKSNAKNDEYICRNCQSTYKKQLYAKHHPKKPKDRDRVCIVCGDRLLIGVNWAKSSAKNSTYICKQCRNAQSLHRRHENGITHPMGENKACAGYLGVYVAERVLSHVFKNVQRMPNNNHGYDFICNHGKKIDVKASCIQKKPNNIVSWQFIINKNHIADYFLLLAFDNRDDLNPMHMWLIPEEKISHLHSATIAANKIHKWDEYKLDISKVTKCCDVLR